MEKTLSGLKVAILATNGFEQSELIEPRKALDQAGAKTEVVSPQDTKITAWKHKEWGIEVPVDVPLKRASPRIKFAAQTTHLPNRERQYDNQSLAHSYLGMSPRSLSRSSVFFFASSTDSPAALAASSNVLLVMFLGSLYRYRASCIRSCSTLN